MKSVLAVLALSILSTSAHAYQLDCVAQNVSYSFDSTDGGANREPIVSLVHDGRVLIRERMFEQPIREGQFELLGRTKVIKTTRPNRQYVVTYFEQQARVTVKNADPVLFSGEVLCKEVKYVGPPRP